MMSGWQLMMFYGFLMFITFKIALWETQKEQPLKTKLAFTFLYVGMNPYNFYTKTSTPPNFYPGAVSFFFGITLFFLTISRFSDTLTGGILLFTAMFFILHFGLLDLNAQFWRMKNRNCQPLMNSPWRANSLSNFWGQRWNLPFRDAVHQFIFKPIQKKYGVKIATMTVFLYSGLIHEAAISLPAQGGYGGSLLYFLWQFAAISLQKRFNSLNNKFFTWFSIIIPIPVLFHLPFYNNVIIPLNQKLGGLL